MPLVVAAVFAILLITALVWMVQWFTWVVAVPVVVGAAYLLGAIGWCIWWCFDSKGATESLRQAERDFARREANRPPKGSRRR